MPSQTQPLLGAPTVSLRSKASFAMRVRRFLAIFARPRRLRRFLGGLLVAILVLDERTRQRAVSAVLTWIFRLMG